MKKLLENDKQVEIREKIINLKERLKVIRKIEDENYNKFKLEKCITNNIDEIILNLYDTCEFCDSVDYCKKKIFRDLVKSYEQEFKSKKESIDIGYKLYFEAIYKENS